ncbi:SDR family oxidoreductase [uncultured Clostridium sp.]|uniref:SDR family oxidoreductase n=1 Tax=uncultured Clostridium sp. TaxID=59620 RepID=UPI0028EFA2E9|nr:SDR family oxidoreductase [uncultured Clostridium sp.]
MNKSMTVLVTGANQGIGFETAKELGAMGFTVLLGARNSARGKEAEESLVKEGIKAHFVLLDVTKQDTIDKVAELIDNTYGSLDVLINNAGIAVEKGRQPSQLDTQDLKETFETNFFGLFAITKAMLPLLIKSTAGRIVNVSSGRGSFANNTKPVDKSLNALAYNSSKAAVNMLTLTFSKELIETSIKINSAAPGYTITAINDFKGHRTVQQAAEIIVKLATLDENGPTGGFFDENGAVPW